jgi:hypothetical protein
MLDFILLPSASTGAKGTSVANVAARNVNMEKHRVWIAEWHELALF